MCGCTAVLCLSGTLAPNASVFDNSGGAIPEIVVTAPRITTGDTLFVYLPNGASGTPLVYSEDTFPTLTFNISSPFLGFLSADRNQDNKVDCVQGLVAGGAPISSPFGMRDLDNDGVDEDFHNGTDITAPTGRLVFSAKPGVVADITYGSGPGTGTAGGNLVRINHNDGTQGVYLHLLSSAAGLAIGDSVLAGEVIATSNNSGTSSDNPHLHYSEWNHQNGGDTQDPNNFTDPASEYGTSCPT